MVQMANQREANNIMRYLDNAPVFGTRLQFQQCKQNIVHNDTEAFTLDNGELILEKKCKLIGNV